MNGAWDQFTADKYHQTSQKLADWMAGYLPKDKVFIDFGCGNAFYVSELSKQGLQGCGVEGTQLNNFQHPEVHIQDLTKRFYLGFLGSVISLEVGEHLPKEAEQIFIDNLCLHCNGSMIISWALPGQPGIGHINCQPQDYIICEFEKRGFKFLKDVTENARCNVDKNTDWFERTLLVFQYDANLLL